MGTCGSLRQGVNSVYCVNEGGVLKRIARQILVEIRCGSGSQCLAIE